VSPPDLNGRRAILDVHTRNKPLAENVDLDIVARQTSGLTGADLANVCTAIVRRGAICATRWSRATSRPRSNGSSPASSRARDHRAEKRVVAYHEAGTRSAPSCCLGEKVHRISIVRAAGRRATRSILPEEDRYSSQGRACSTYLVVRSRARYRAARVGSVTTGASDDLR